MSLADEVASWLDAYWSLDLTVREWWHRLAGAGYAYPTWPAGVGGSSLSGRDARTITGLLAAHRVVGPPTGHLAATLAAPTILQYGTPEQVRQLVGPIARGETSWCQLFSEPGAGSDLAGLGTRAVQDGDEWIVTGQKVWNSAADAADLGMLLARTDHGAPKHGGITYFALDMHQPGVEVRPLRVMNGTAAFCEVFLTEARVPADRVIGEVNGGWQVAKTTLRHERSSLVGSGTPGLYAARPRDVDRRVGDVVERARRTARARRSPIRTGAVGAKAMVDLARHHGAAGDPIIRQELARYHAQVRINGWTMRRIAASNERRGLTGADGSIAKLTTSRICQDSRDLSYRIVGAPLLLDGADSPFGGDLQAVNLASPGTRIGGGTDEIQLTIVGERALGLPREPD